MRRPVVERIIKLLSGRQVKNHSIEMDGKEYRFAVINNDKVVFFVSVETPEDIMIFNNKLPSLKGNLKLAINEFLSKKSKSYEDIRIDIPSFLWDLYIVGLHQISKDEDRFDNLEVNKIRHDHFIARKIIIEYKNEDDLEEELIKNIFPEMKLNKIVAGLKSVEQVNIKDILRNVDEKKVDKSFADLNDVSQYCDEIASFIETL